VITNLENTAGLKLILCRQQVCKLFLVKNVFKCTCTSCSATAKLGV